MQEHSSKVIERSINHVETTNDWAYSPEVLDGPGEPNGRLHASRMREQEMLNGHQTLRDVHTDSSVVIELLVICVFVCAFCTCAGMCAFQTKPVDLKMPATPDASAAPEEPGSPAKPKPAGQKEPEAPVEPAAPEKTASLDPTDPTPHIAVLPPSGPLPVATESETTGALFMMTAVQLLPSGHLPDPVPFLDANVNHGRNGATGVSFFGMAADGGQNDAVDDYDLRFESVYSTSVIVHYNAERGFGYISYPLLPGDDAYEKDVFFHVSECHNEDLEIGTVVQFLMMYNESKNRVEARDVHDQSSDEFNHACSLAVAFETTGTNDYLVAYEAAHGVNEDVGEDGDDNDDYEKFWLTGYIKWYDADRGFGCIDARTAFQFGDDLDSPEIFFHVNDFYFNEYYIPASGRIVQFDVTYNGLKDRWEARDVHDEYSDEFDESSVPEDLKEYLVVTFVA